MCVFFYHQLTSETKHFQCVHATASSKSLRGLCRRRGNFVDAYDVRVCVATWNVNGGKLFRSIAFKDKVMSESVCVPLALLLPWQVRGVELGGRAAVATARCEMKDWNVSAHLLFMGIISLTSLRWCLYLSRQKNVYSLGQSRTVLESRVRNTIATASFKESIGLLR